MDEADDGPAPHNAELAPYDGEPAPHDVELAPHDVEPAHHGVKPAPHDIEPAHHGGDLPPQDDGLAPRIGSPALSEFILDNDRPRRRGVDLAGLIAREDEDGLGK